MTLYCFVCRETFNFVLATLSVAHTVLKGPEDILRGSFNRILDRLEVLESSRSDLRKKQKKIAEFRKKHIFAASGQFLENRGAACMHTIARRQDTQTEKQTSAREQNALERNRKVTESDTVSLARRGDSKRLRLRTFKIDRKEVLKKIKKPFTKETNKR